MKALRELCFNENLIRIGLIIPKTHCPAENNEIQKEFHIIIGYIAKSIFPTYDSFRLITSYIEIVLDDITEKNSWYLVGKGKKHFLFVCLFVCFCFVLFVCLFFMKGQFSE